MRTQALPRTRQTQLGDWRVTATPTRNGRAVAVTFKMRIDSEQGLPRNRGRKSRGRWSFAASATARLQVMRTKGVLACRMRSPRTCWMYPMPQYHVRAPQWICAPLHSFTSYIPPLLLLRRRITKVRSSRTRNSSSSFVAPGALASGHAVMPVSTVVSKAEATHALRVP